MSDQILYQYGHIFKIGHYVDSEVGKAVLKNLDRLDAIHKLATDKVRKINLTPDLTAKGKINAYRSLAEETNKDLAAVLNATVGFGNRESQIAESMKTQQHPRDDVAWHLEQREIRDHINSLDVVERESFVLSAIENGNQQVMQAVQFAPFPFTFATQQMMDRITEVRAELQYPDQAEQLRDFRTAELEVSSALGSVTSSLADLGLNTSTEGQTEPDAA